MLLIVMAIQIGCMVYSWKNSRWSNWIALMAFQLVCVVFSYFGVCKYNWGGLAHLGDFLLYAISLFVFLLILLITFFLAIIRTPSRRQREEEAREKVMSENQWPPIGEE